MATGLSIKKQMFRRFSKPSSFQIFFSSLSFSPWNPAIHDEAREKMLTQKVSTGRL